MSFCDDFITKQRSAYMELSFGLKLATKLDDAFDLRIVFWP